MLLGSGATLINRISDIKHSHKPALMYTTTASKLHTLDFHTICSFLTVQKIQKVCQYGAFDCMMHRVARHFHCFQRSAVHKEQGHARFT